MQTDSPNAVLSENGKFYTMNHVSCVASLKVSEIYSSCVHAHIVPDWCDNESETTQLLYRGGYRIPGKGVNMICARKAYV